MNISEIWIINIFSKANTGCMFRNTFDPVTFNHSSFATVWVYFISFSPTPPLHAHIFTPSLSIHIRACAHAYTHDASMNLIIQCSVIGFLHTFSASTGGHSDVVSLLVQADADIDSQDNRKVSCLMAAFRRGHIKVVKWMVKKVTQFPSENEIKRYIATITDKVGWPLTMLDLLFFLNF